MSSVYRFKPDEQAAVGGTRREALLEALLTDIAFDSAEFLAMPLAKRSELCVSLAVRAKALADAAPLQQQQDYLLIAHEWLRLAEQIEQIIAESGDPD